MADYATKQDIKDIDKRFDNIDKRFDDLTALLSNFANDVNDRFDVVDQKLTGVEHRLDGVDEDLRKLNKNYDHLVNTIIDGFLARIDHYETELAARDAEIARLKAWVEAIAQKTGVKQPV